MSYRGRITAALSNKLVVKRKTGLPDELELFVGKLHLVAGDQRDLLIGIELRPVDIGAVGGTEIADIALSGAHADLRVLTADGIIVADAVIDLRLFFTDDELRLVDTNLIAAVFAQEDKTCRTCSENSRIAGAFVRDGVERTRSVGAEVTQESPWSARKERPSITPYR